VWNNVRQEEDVILELEKEELTHPRKQKAKLDKKI
jgi:hypothetical protein